MKPFATKRLLLTFIILLLVGHLIVAACSSERTSTAFAAPASTAEPTPRTCESSIFAGQTLEHSLSWSGEECHFDFFATAGEVVTITLHSKDGDFYPYLKLYTPDGSWLTANDDDAYSLDSRITAQQLLMDGKYTIVASAYEYSGFGRFDLELAKEDGSIALTTSECGDIAYGQTRIGVLFEADGTCSYHFQASAGDTVTLSTYSLDEDFDSYLELYDPYDLLLAENDDDEFSLNSYIPRQLLPWDGWYTIVVKSYNAESFGWFELTLTATGDDSISPPTRQPEVVRPEECGRTIVYGALVFDTITWPGEECYFRFLATANDRVTITMYGINETLDPQLALYGPTNLWWADNDDCTFNFDSCIEGQILPLTGWYTIIASSYNADSVGRFELTLTRTEATAP